MPDVCHQAANIDKGLMKSIGCEQADEKSLFLRRFRHGPFRGAAGSGQRHWHAQLVLAWQEIGQAGFRPRRDPSDCPRAKFAWVEWEAICWGTVEAECKRELAAMTHSRMVGPRM